MTRRWPYHFPMGTKDGYKLSPIDKVMRSDMEVGAPRVRKITTANIDRLNISWRFTDVQMSAFRAWFDDLPWSITGESDSLGAILNNNTTIGPSPITGPDNQAASRILETAVSGLHIARFNVTCPDNTNAQFTATVRAAGRSFCRLAFLRKDNLLAQFTANLATGAVSSVSASVIRYQVIDRGNGWWALTLLTNSVSGATTPSARVQLMQDETTSSYLGDITAGVDVTDFQARVATGYDLFLPTDTVGNAKGANSGSAWFAMPVALGNGGIERREVRFIGTFAVAALPGFNWEVSANLEVRNA